MAADAETAAGGARAFLSRLHARLGDLWWYTLLIFAVQRLGEAVNLFVGIWLVPKFVPADELGAVAPLMSVAAFVGFPIAIVLLPAGKFLNVFVARKEFGKAKALLVDAVAVSLLFAVGVAVWLFAKGDGILDRMHIADRRVFIPIAGFAILTCVDPIVQSAQRSFQRFKGMMLSGLVVPYVRLAGMLLLLPSLGALGYLSAQMAMSLAGTLIGCFVLLRVFRGLGRRESYRSSWREMLAYSAPLLALTLASRVQMPVESFVIRHRLPLDVSAGYYFATTFGLIPGYAVSALMTVLWPIVSDKFEKGERTDRLLAQSMLFTLLAGGAVLVALALAVPFVFRLPGPWRGYEGYSRFVWQVGLLTLLKNAQGVFTSHESACRRFRFVCYLVPLYLVEAGVLYALPAWGLFRPFLPAALWSFVDGAWSLSLQSFLVLLLFFNALFLLAMAVDWLSGRRGAPPPVSPASA